MSSTSKLSTGVVSKHQRLPLTTSTNSHQRPHNEQRNIFFNDHSSTSQTAKRAAVITPRVAITPVTADPPERIALPITFMSKRRDSLLMRYKKLNGTPPKPVATKRPRTSAIEVMATNPLENNEVPPALWWGASKGGEPNPVIGKRPQPTRKPKRRDNLQKAQRNATQARSPLTSVVASVAIPLVAGRTKWNFTAARSTNWGDAALFPWATTKTRALEPNVAELDKAENTLHSQREVRTDLYNTFSGKREVIETLMAKDADIKRLTLRNTELTVLLTDASEIIEVLKAANKDANKRLKKWANAPGKME